MGLGLGVCGCGLWAVWGCFGLTPARDFDLGVADYLWWCGFMLDCFCGFADVWCVVWFSSVFWVLWVGVA